MSERNPVIIPKSSSGRRACAKCGDLDWYGRNVQGVVTFKCKKCGFEWYGGLPQVAQDPGIPMPAESYEPTVKFVENSKEEGGVEEIRRRPDLRADFRKGAPIPNDGEE